jgi:predicted LPLAT superfamily acyltransferase
MFEEIVPEYSPDRPLVTVTATAWRPERHRNAKFNAALLAMAPDLAAEVLELRAIAAAAADLAALWKAMNISGLPRAERNAAIEETRNRLIAALEKYPTPIPG